MIIIDLMMTFLEIFLTVKSLHAGTEISLYFRTGNDLSLFIDRQETFFYIPEPDMQRSLLSLCRDQDYEASGYPMISHEFGGLHFINRSLRITECSIIRYARFVKIT